MPTPPTPTSGVIRLLNVPFDSSYKNVLDFENDDARFNYMIDRQITNQGSDIKYHFTDCQYSRRDGTLRVPTHIDKLYNCNYLMYQNPFYSDKWFYCFVTAQRYVNDNCTELKIDTDVYSTWITSANIKPSFVEREHTNDDAPGNNTIPEGLETGEIVTTVQYDLTNEFKPEVLLAFTGDKIGSRAIDVNGGYYNGIPSSIPFLLSKINIATALIEKINQNSQGDKILTIFTVPHLAVKDLIETPNVDETINQTGFYQLPRYTQQGERTIFEPYLSNPEGKYPGRDHYYWDDYSSNYVPRNKKLLTYPYTYLTFNPPNGSSKIYRFEDFIGRWVMFNAFSEINPNPSVLLTPVHYQHLGLNIQESSIVNGYPNLSYKNDVFNTWLAQNSQLVNISTDRAKFDYDVQSAHNNIAQTRETTNALTGLITSAVGGVASAITGNIGGVINSVAGGVGGFLNSGYNLQDLEWNQVSNAGNWMYDVRSINAQVEKQSMMPDTGSLSSSNATLLGYNLLGRATFSVMAIKREYVEKIDKYFDMFGYQTNAVKTPNLKGRKNWNYVKTININITGRIPLSDLNKLKSIFDTGITIWHNPNTIYNYDADNYIV